METPTIHPQDLLTIEGLRSGDPAITAGFFNDELSALLQTIRQKVFAQRVSYDELVNDLYLHLAAQGWHKLDTFAARGGCRLRSWVSAVAWRHFIKSSEEALSTTSTAEELASILPAGQPDVELQMRMDVQATLTRMPNRRYSHLLTLLFLEGCSPKEAAEELHTTTDNIYNMKRRAIEQFTTYFK